MVYRFGRGLNRRGDAGLGFQGNSLAWPYVGRGRGGLPRCGYFLSGQANVPPGALKTTREQEINWLKSQAEAIKAELNQVEARILDLETGK